MHNILAIKKGYKTTVPEVNNINIYKCPKNVDWDLEDP